jgi:hypothetical protein
VSTVTAGRLEDLLQAAVELEMSTVPPYLCALYSLQPQVNDEARLVIRSVVVEEMLHMVLAANVLNAIGGRPRLSGADHVPRYPHELPSGVVLHLLPFSAAAIEAFLKVENPDYDYHALDRAHPLLSGRPSEHHVSRAATLVSSKPTTIGGFYAEIIAGLKESAAAIGEQELFCGEPGRQVTREYYYAGGGAPIEVTDLESACRALAEIVEQGEGDMTSMYDDSDDLAHFYRFLQLKHDRGYLRSDGPDNPTGPAMGVDFSAVYPMLTNPRGADYTDPSLRAVSDAANRAWSELLMQIDAAFDGQPQALLPAVHSMFKVRDAALVLLANPLPDRAGHNAGPTFEWDPGTAAAPAGTS